jgi:N-acetylmuramoyl-L-alanine amidase
MLNLKPPKQGLWRLEYLFSILGGLVLFYYLYGSVPGGWAQTPAESGADPDRQFTVILDPGHGGRDQGLVAKPDDPRSEKVLMLKLAGALKSRLEKRGLNVQLTRSGDESASLLDRVSLANRKNADVFLSLHLGRRAGSRQVPTRIFVHRSPAFKEKRTHSLSGRLVSWDDAQPAFRARSRKLADSLRSLGTGHSVEVIEVPMAMLAGVNHPAVMVELPPPATNDWRQETERLTRGLEQYLSNR